MDIKQCTSADVAQLRDICCRTFIETFAAQNTKEDMECFLAESFSEKRLTEELRDPESFTYIACENDEPIGYLKLNIGAAQTEKGFDNSLEIQRIYLISDVKGRGLGTELIRFSVEKARELSLDFIWLGVWECNYPALKFYEKLGFEQFSQHTFVLGDDKQTDLLMRKYL